VTGLTGQSAVRQTGLSALQGQEGGVDGDATLFALPAWPEALSGGSVRRNFRMSKSVTCPEQAGSSVQDAPKVGGS
jgi:ribosomal protein L27